MGGSTSQPVTKETEQQSVQQTTEEMQKLFGTRPYSIVLVERYVQQLWHALDKTVEHQR